MEEVEQQNTQEENIDEVKVEENSLEVQVKKATIEKIELEKKELAARIGSYESIKAKNTKFIVSVATPIITALLALTAALIGWRNQISTEQQRQFNRIQELLSNKDPQVQNEAINKLLVIDPNIAEQTCSKLITLLSSDNDNVSNAASVSLATIGTERAVNELTASVSTLPSNKAVIALETLGKIHTKHSFENVFSFIKNKDPRIAGRCKAILGSSFPDDLIEKSLTISNSSDVPLANAVLDAVTFIDNRDIGPLLWKFSQFNGNTEEYLNELNPRDRSLRLLFETKLTEEQNDLLWKRFQDKTIAKDEKALLALNLINSKYKEQVIPTLVNYNGSNKILIADLLSKSQNNSAVAEKILLNDLNSYTSFPRELPESFYYISSNKIKINEAALLNLLKTSSNIYNKYAAAMLLIKRQPLEVGTEITGFDEIAKSNILIQSPLKEQRKEGITLWMKSLQNNKETDPFNPISISTSNLKNIPEIDSLKETLLTFFRSPSFAISKKFEIAEALITTDYANTILDTLRTWNDSKKINRWFYYTFMCSNGYRKDVLNDLLQDIKNIEKLDIDVDSKGDFMSQMTKLSIGTSEERIFIKYYFDWIDRATVYKDFHNWSYVAGDPVSLSDSIIPELAHKLYISIGARYVNHYSELLIGWWAVNGKEKFGH